MMMFRKKIFVGILRGLWWHSGLKVAWKQCPMGQYFSWAHFGWAQCNSSRALSLHHPSRLLTGRGALWLWKQMPGAAAHLREIILFSGVYPLDRCAVIKKGGKICQKAECAFKGN